MIHEDIQTTESNTATEKAEFPLRSRHHSPEFQQDQHLGESELKEDSTVNSYHSE